MLSVTRIFHFSAAHRLFQYDGDCGKIHGHNYEVRVKLSSHVCNGQGMVVDFKDIKKMLGAWIDEELDHSLMLHVLDPLCKEPVILANAKLCILHVNPTAEMLAAYIRIKTEKFVYGKYTSAVDVASVIVYETHNSFAEDTSHVSCK